MMSIVLTIIAILIHHFVVLFSPLRHQQSAESMREDGTRKRTFKRAISPFSVESPPSRLHIEHGECPVSVGGCAEVALLFFFHKRYFVCSVLVLRSYYLRPVDYQVEDQ